MTIVISLIIGAVVGFIIRHVLPFADNVMKVYEHEEWE